MGDGDFNDGAVIPGIGPTASPCEFVCRHLFTLSEGSLTCL